MGRVVVFGSVVHDLISYTDRFPRPGESVRGHHFYQGNGGKGANQAVAAARLGAEVSLIARVGDDVFGRLNVENLEKAGVDTKGVERSTTSHTATATITVTADGENCIVVTLGANMELDEAVADRQEEIIKSGAIVIGQGEVPEGGNRRAFELAKKHGVRTFFNPAPGDPKLDKSILYLVDILCVNENETEFLTGTEVKSTDDAKAAGKRLLETGPSIVLITLGSKGFVYVDKDTCDYVQGKKVEAVDTTGAGDCFVGSFAYFLTTSLPGREAARRASVIASLAVTRKGTQDAYFTKEEILKADPSLLS